jgi:hypothetical protein
VYFTPSTSLVASVALDTPARAALCRPPTAEKLYTSESQTDVSDSDVKDPTPSARTPTPGMRTPLPSSPRPAPPASTSTPRKHTSAAPAPNALPQTPLAPRQSARSPLPFPPRPGALLARCAHKPARRLLGVLCRTTGGACARGYARAGAAVAAAPRAYDASGNLPTFGTPSSGHTHWSTRCNLALYLHALLLRM